MPLFSGMRPFYAYGWQLAPTNCYVLGINVYSSKDLLNWKNEGKALSPINGTEIGPETVVERPKVVYSEPTKTWVVGGQLKHGGATRINPSSRCGSTRTTAHTVFYDKVLQRAPISQVLAKTKR